MKKIFLIFCLINIIIFNSFGQIGELIGSGVLDFLLSNPKTFNNMSVGERVAGGIVSDLLKTQSNRRYQLKYADASADKITINTTDGRQAQFVKDANNKVYILLDGIIYPIAQEFVEQSKNIDNVSSSTSTSSSTIQPYNLEILKNKYISSGINNFNVRNIFAYKWSKDFDGDGYLSFDEFKQIKNTFYDNENLRIVVDYEVIKNSNVELVLEINDDYTGELIFSNIMKLSEKALNSNLVYYYISAGDLPIGTYLMVVKLQDAIAKKGYSSLMEKIQLIHGDSSKREIPFYKGNFQKEKINRSYFEIKSLLIDNRDNQKYKIVKIGDQTWMAENLNYKTSNSLCYDNNSSNCATYGRLYTFEEAKNVCPTGWHLPTEAEWYNLINYLGKRSAGAQMIEIGTSHWKKNKHATNSSNFTALPGGAYNNGKFKGLGLHASFWNSKEGKKPFCAILFSQGKGGAVLLASQKGVSRSVRCLKD